MPALVLSALCLGVLWLVLHMFAHLVTLLGVCVLFTYLLLPLVDGLEHMLTPLLKEKNPIPIRRWRRISWPKALLGNSVPKLTPRLMAIIMLFTLSGMALVVGLTWVLPLVVAQGNDLLKALPRYAMHLRQLVQTVVPGVPPLPFTLASWPTWLQQQAGQWVRSGEGPLALTHLGDVSAQGLRGLIYGFCGISVVFYLLLDGKQRAAWVMRLLPVQPWRQLALECHTVLARFVKGQVLLAVISGALMLTLYSVFGVPHALVLSLVFTVAEIFPVIGPWFAFTPGIVVMLLGDNPWVTVYVLGIYFLLKDNIILPKVVGEVMGIHPVWIIMAIIVAAKLGGAVGVIFAVPLAALLGVLWGYAFNPIPVALVTAEPAKAMDRSNTNSFN
jgi:predicted PurR-regulated permease PerM